MVLITCENANCVVTCMYAEYLMTYEYAYALDKYLNDFLFKSGVAI